jgi:hypothetical protein
VERQQGNDNGEKSKRNDNDAALCIETGHTSGACVVLNVVVAKCSTGSCLFVFRRPFIILNLRC